MLRGPAQPLNLALASRLLPTYFALHEQPFTYYLPGISSLGSGVCLSFDLATRQLGRYGCPPLRIPLTDLPCKLVVVKLQQLSKGHIQHILRYRSDTEATDRVHEWSVSVS